MKYAFTILAFAICLSGALLRGNDSPNWHLNGAHEGWRDEFLAVKYFHNSELQRQWAWHLLGSYHFEGSEQVLDFGCGDGKITAEVSHFIPQGDILGVDLSPSMISFAQRCFPSAHYPNATFEPTTDVDFRCENRDKKYDLVYSFCVFHIIPNPIQVLNNLRARLKQDGKLLLVIPAGNNPALFQAANETFEKYKLSPPWSSKDKETPNVTMRTKEGCIHCLISAGFEPLSVVALHTPTAFFNKQELVEWMIGTMTPNWRVPLDKAEAFFNDLIDRMAELDRDVIGESGAYNLKLSRLEVTAMLNADL